MDRPPRDRSQREVAKSLSPGAESQAIGDPLLAADGNGQAANGRLTPVMVRFTAAELETVDTLIAAGVAGSRAGAIRWVLARIRARPAYAQLRRRAGDIQSLQAEF